MSIFTPEDLKFVRDAVSGRSFFAGSRDIEALIPHNTELNRKLGEDEHTAVWGLLPLFPGVHELFYNYPKKPIIRDIESNRKNLMEIIQGDKKIIVKIKKTKDEGIIGQTLGEFGICPRIIANLGVYIVEEHLGVPYNSFKDLSNEKIEEAGYRIGHILGIVHREDICYNNLIFKHLMTQEGMITGIVDFSESFSLGNHPHYTDGEILRFAKGQPNYKTYSRDAQTRAIIDYFGARLTLLKIEEIKNIDFCNLRKDSKKYFKEKQIQIFGDAFNTSNLEIDSIGIQIPKGEC